MNSSIARLTLAAALVPVFSLSVAHAQQSGLSYDYIGVGITKGEILDQDFTGFGADASVSLNDVLFAKGSVSTGESDDEVFLPGFGADEAEVTGFTAGLGFHTPIGSNVDMVAGIEYVSTELEFGGASDDVNGFGLDFGVRALVSENFELQGAVNYVDGDDVDGEFGFDITGRFYLTPQFALTAGYFDGDETNGITAGLRFNFR